jgi:pilus assembly protein Flp/PilA
MTPTKGATMVALITAAVALQGPQAHEGQGLVEYGLIIILIAITVMAMLSLLGTQIGSTYSDITTALP